MIMDTEAEKAPIAVLQTGTGGSHCTKTVPYMCAHVIPVSDDQPGEKKRHFIQHGCQECGRKWLSTWSICRYGRTRITWWLLVMISRDGQRLVH